jgi:hypothetical protein
MPITINKSGFKQATIFLEDILFKFECKNKNTSDLQKLKILEARLNNPDFETEIALFICGDGNSFPYRSSFFLSKFFTDLGLNYSHDGSTRRIWVKDVLLELSVSELSLIIRKGLFNKRDFRKHSKETGIDAETSHKSAINEFKQFMEESIEKEPFIDLSYLLNLNINVELLFDRKIVTQDNELDSLITEAKERFFNPKDKQIAVEKLWDAFERIKTYFESNKKRSSTRLIEISSNDFNSELVENEFKLLTTIGNEYRIRHHETGKLEIKNSKHIDYLFFRMLSLIDLCLKSIKEE